MLHSIGNAEEFHTFVKKMSNNILNTLNAYAEALPREEVRKYIREQGRDLNEIFNRQENRYEDYYQIKEILVNPKGDQWMLRTRFRNPIACKGNIYIKSYLLLACRLSLIISRDRYTKELRRVARVIGNAGLNFCLGFVPESRWYWSEEKDFMKLLNADWEYLMNKHGESFNALEPETIPDIDKIYRNLFPPPSGDC